MDVSKYGFTIEGRAPKVEDNYLGQVEQMLTNFGTALSSDAVYMPGDGLRADGLFDLENMNQSMLWKRWVISIPGAQINTMMSTPECIDVWVKAYVGIDVSKRPVPGAAGAYPTILSLSVEFDSDRTKVPGNYRGLMLTLKDATDLKHAKKAIIAYTANRRKFVDAVFKTVAEKAARTPKPIETMIAEAEAKMLNPKGGSTFLVLDASTESVEKAALAMIGFSKLPFVRLGKAIVVWKTQHVDMKAIKPTFEELEKAIRTKDFVKLAWEKV